MMKETKSQARKRQILTKKIKGLLMTYKPIFITLTFNDKTLSRTNEKTRERLIKKYLKNNTALYIANKDYGDKNGREHYHALVIATTLNNDDLKHYHKIKDLRNQINLYNWHKYGIINIKQVAFIWRPKGDIDYKKTADNLSRHIRKPSTKESRIIASRGTPSKDEQIKRLKALRITKEQHKKPTYKEGDLLSDEIAEFNDYIENDFIDLIDDEIASLNETEKGEIIELADRCEQEPNNKDIDLVKLYWQLMKKRY